MAEKKVMMTAEERKLFDARAEHEAWAHAMSILEPWLRIVREIGTDELTQVMERALREVEREVTRTLDVLEPLVEREKNQ